MFSSKALLSQRRFSQAVVLFGVTSFLMWFASTKLIEAKEPAEQAEKFKLYAPDRARQGETFTAVVLAETPEGDVPLHEGDEVVFNGKVVERIKPKGIVHVPPEAFTPDDARPEPGSNGSSESSQPLTIEVRRAFGRATLARPGLRQKLPTLKHRVQFLPLEPNVQTRIAKVSPLVSTGVPFQVLGQGLDRLTEAALLDPEGKAYTLDRPAGSSLHLIYPEVALPKGTTAGFTAWDSEGRQYQSPNETHHLKLLIDGKHVSKPGEQGEVGITASHDARVQVQVQPKGVVSIWEGTFDAPGGKRMVLKYTALKPGEWQLKPTAVDLEELAAPLATLVQSYPEQAAPTEFAAPFSPPLVSQDTPQDGERRYRIGNAETVYTYAAGKLVRVTDTRYQDDGKTPYDQRTIEYNPATGRATTMTVTYYRADGTIRRRTETQFDHLERPTRIVETFYNEKGEITGKKETEYKYNTKTDKKEKGHKRTREALEPNFDRWSDWSDWQKVSRLSSPQSETFAALEPDPRAALSQLGNGAAAELSQARTKPQDSGIARSLPQARSATPEEGLKEDLRGYRKLTAEEIRRLSATGELTSGRYFQRGKDWYEKPRYGVTDWGERVEVDWEAMLARNPDSPRESSTRTLPGGVTLEQLKTMTASQVWGLAFYYREPCRYKPGMTAEEAKKAEEERKKAEEEVRHFWRTLADREWFQTRHGYWLFGIGVVYNLVTLPFTAPGGAAAIYGYGGARTATAIAASRAAGFNVAREAAKTVGWPRPEVTAGLIRYLRSYGSLTGAEEMAAFRLGQILFGVGGRASTMHRFVLWWDKIEKLSGIGLTPLP